MKILADENIALVNEAFAGFGELRIVPGRSIGPELLKDVDVLLVRSVTRVDSKLLQGSPCRFVGTATSGTDHIDTAWLEQQGIAFAQALGSNAASVVDYVISACAFWSMKSGRDWRKLGFGIIGCGEVGGRLARRLQALGTGFRIYDPLLPPTHPLSASFADLNEVLQQDVVSIHTPLTHSGAWPSFHMLDAAHLALLAPDAILINAARGEVIDTQALLARMKRYPDSCVMLDAWEGEPCINTELLHKVCLSTPHIAGYSRLGKLNGTAMVQQAFCEHFGLPRPSGLFTVQEQKLEIAFGQQEDWQQLNQVILSAYDIGRDHQAMQSLLGGDNTRENFDSLRRNYPERLEFSQFRLACEHLPAALLADVKALGFRTTP